MSHDWSLWMGQLQCGLARAGLGIRWITPYSIDRTCCCVLSQKVSGRKKDPHFCNGRPKFGGWAMFARHIPPENIIVRQHAVCMICSARQQLSNGMRGIIVSRHVHENRCVEVPIQTALLAEKSVFALYLGNRCESCHADCTLLGQLDALHSNKLSNVS